YRPARGTVTSYRLRQRSSSSTLVRGGERVASAPSPSTVHRMATVGWTEVRSTQMVCRPAGMSTLYTCPAVNRVAACGAERIREFTPTSTNPGTGNPKAHRITVAIAHRDGRLGRLIGDGASITLSACAATSTFRAVQASCQVWTASA